MVSESQATGVTFPYERQAMRGEEMPDHLCGPDRWMYIALRYLYAQYQKKEISREAATRDKKKLMESYETFKGLWEMGEHWSQVLRNTDLARAEFNQNPTVENGRKLVQAIDGRNT